MYSCARVIVITLLHLLTRGLGLEVLRFACVEDSRVLSRTLGEHGGLLNRLFVNT